MNAAKPQTQTSRGLALILEHCARLQSIEPGRPPAASRLSQAIGDELARLLLHALSGDHSTRPRRVQLGRSSP